MFKAGQVSARPQGPRRPAHHGDRFSVCPPQGAKLAGGQPTRPSVVAGRERDRPSDRGGLHRPERRPRAARGLASQINALAGLGYVHFWYHGMTSRRPDYGRLERGRRPVQTVEMPIW